jgi:GPH family glycoside/pentoside/hexuronide:cation symporter/probable glucitol transport protein GutA
MGQFANNMSWAMVGTFLALFYTDVVGLTPAAVVTISLITKIWDGINDPGEKAGRTLVRLDRFFQEPVKKTWGFGAGSTHNHFL